MIGARSSWPRTIVAVLICTLVVLLAGVPAIASEWTTYAGGPLRQMFNSNETGITPANIHRLGVKWAFPTGAVVTGGSTVALVDVPGEGEIQVAYIQSWDGNMYALRLDDGSAVWSFATDLHPGSSYPNVGSVHVAEVGGAERIFFGAGQTLYCLDAATGVEVWRFDAGTGCLDPPDLCGFGGERNQIESSPITADGKVFFGMDVNDRATGKGGMYAVDEVDGRLVWFFDLETATTCTPFPADDIRRFDGYHTEVELGLPAGFLATRPGCNFDRTPTGCGNVWSSPAYDAGRDLLYIASSNCDTDNDPMTNEPPPPMPPYDEALFAIDVDGVPAWRWRPREVDNADLAFGAVPNLFTIDFGGGSREVVGIGNKDGTYYVIDRDGVNEVSGVAWDDPDPSMLPYWSTNLVPGGAIGGIVGTSSVDEATGRIYASTGPGFVPFDIQRPTVHALDMNDGSIVWQNTEEPLADASFAPTSAIPEIVFAGAVIDGRLRFYDADTGEKLGNRRVGNAVACPATIVDGVVLIGGGIGELSSNPMNLSHISAMVPHDVTAFCIIGQPGCPGRMTGKKLLVQDKAGKPDKRRLTVKSKDPETIFTPDVDDAPANPALGGAELTILNPTTLESQTIDLPLAGWEGLGSPAGAKGYRYEDPQQSFGPCKKVVVKPGKVVSASCKGAGISFTLDEASQGSLGVRLALGAAKSFEYCALFGGDVSKDFGTAGGAGLFKAKEADAPGACP